MGGMAAQIPIKNDAAANEAALEKVRADKLREVKAGHDGTWVAHPGLVEVALKIFNEHMPGTNQIINKREDVKISQKELLAIPEGQITENGLRHNINVGILYLEAWFRGIGCVPIYNLMEDAATAEICRTQVWQWIRHQAKTTEGRLITTDVVREILAEELDKIRNMIGPEAFNKGQFKKAAILFLDMSTRIDCPDFLTLIAYEYID